MSSKTLFAAAALALAAAVSGCRVHTDRNADGDEKNVRIDTPFGGVHVATDAIKAADLGLPAYPGAEPVTDDKHKSADVHVGFGEWQLRVRAVSYSSTDSREKIVAFYRKALGRYGDVITCQGNTPVGAPTATSEGLTCAGDGRHSAQADGVEGYDLTRGLTLKAGSRRHMHVVGFEDEHKGATRFALVAVDLPTGQGATSD